MFVVDAFIRNIDRNNTNWGILRNPRGEFSLAPVYDNGNSFNNKRTESGIERRLANPDLIRQDALDVRSCYVTDKGAPIAPLKYIMSGQDEECTKALDRFMERYDPRSLHDLLDSVPSTSHGLTVAPKGFHDYHRRVCDYRYEHAFVEAWRELHPAVGFPSRPEPSEPLPDPDPSIVPSSSSAPIRFDGPGR